MELALNLETIIQALAIAAVVGFYKSTRDLVSVVKLHDWRIQKLEERPAAQCCDSKSG